MTAQQHATGRRVLSVAVAKGSRAEKRAFARAGLPGTGAQDAGTAPVLTEAIAPGVSPTPAHNLVFHKGRTIPHLVFTNFYVGGADAWPANTMRLIDAGLAAVMSDARLNNVMMQYFDNQPITTTFLPSRVLPGPKPRTFSRGDVSELVRRLDAQGQLKANDPRSTVFNFMLPSGTVLTTEEQPTQAATAPTASSTGRRRERVDEADSSLEGLGGYHGSVHLSPTRTVYFAVGVFSERLADGTENGIVAFKQPWKNVVATFYHELNEARTDPDVEEANDSGNNKLLGWVSRQGEECGDFPLNSAGFDLALIMKEIRLTKSSRRAPVQFQYSNAVAGPEGPIAAPHTGGH